jgi:hypothetical protein
LPPGQPHSDGLADTGLLHRDAIHVVAKRHHAVVVGEGDELAVVPVTLKKLLGDA